MADKYRFEVRVTGDGFSPESLSMRQIGDFLVAIENLVAAAVSHTQPSLTLNKREALQLSSLKGGSVNLAFATPYWETGPALRFVGGAVKDGDSARLPAEASASVQKMLKISQKHNICLDFREADGKCARLLFMTPTTRFHVPAVSPLVTGTTTLYGKLLRIGGDNSPTAEVRFLDDEKITCKVCSVDLAREMAERLYEIIGVRGRASWATSDMSLQDFRIEQLTEYRQTSLTEAFESLRELAEEHYQKIGDIDAFIADLRGREPEDE